MEPDEAAAVAAWLKTALDEVSGVGYAQIDIDQLFDKPPALAVPTGLRCLSATVNAIMQEIPDVDGILTVPLKPSARLEQESPTVVDVLAHQWRYAPGISVPGLYLVRAALWRAYEPVEEYRKHLSSEGVLPGGFAAYYRTWRPVVDESHYDRAIYIRTVGVLA